MKADRVRPCRTEPVEVEGEPGVRLPGLDERRDREGAEHHELEDDQHDLDPLGGGDAPVGDPGRDRDEDQTGDHVDQAVLPEVADRSRVDQVAQELVEELHRHPGEVRQHDDRGEDRRPATEPPDVGTEGLGRPGERGATVRGDLVELPVGVRREEHRQEARDDDHRHLAARLGDEDADGRGQRVRRRDGRDAEDGAAEEADLAFGQSLAVEVGLDLVAWVVVSLHGRSLSTPEAGVFCSSALEAVVDHHVLDAGVVLEPVHDRSLP